MPLWLPKVLSASKMLKIEIQPKETSLNTLKVRTLPTARQSKLKLKTLKEFRNETIASQELGGSRKKTPNSNDRKVPRKQ